MKQRVLILFCAALLLGGTVLPVGADAGPKPSVNITILGLEGRRCYGTLMGFQENYAPYQAVGPGEKLDIPEEASPEEVEAWQAFQAYSQEQGHYFFYQQVWDASDGAFSWTYYPPQSFQVVLWFPETGTLVTSQPDERYAFDSYFTLDMTGKDLSNTEMYTWIQMTESYDHTGEAASLAARVVLTIAVEAAVAWIFRLRRRRQLGLILGVNLVTQLALNVGLNWTAYQDGTGQIFLRYALMELGVFAAEAVLYVRLLPAPERTGAKRLPLVVGYAAAANLLSLVVGWALACILPGIF